MTVSCGRSSVGGLTTPDNIKGMECGPSNFGTFYRCPLGVSNVCRNVVMEIYVMYAADVGWVQLSCDVVSSTPTAKAFDGSSAPMDPVISRGSFQSITGWYNDS